MKRLLLALIVGGLMLVPPSAGVGVTVSGYVLTEITLPSFASLSADLYNYVGVQYPTIGFSGQCVNDILYINNFSKVACFDPDSGSVKNISAAVTLLHQRTAGIQAQIDNEIQLDSGSDIALLYGNASTSAGPVTVETVNLTTGVVRTVTTPVPMSNSIQADYVGHDTVVTWNASGTNGGPEMTNMSNGTSWRSGLSVGVAPNNVYWDPALRAFIDVAGTHVAELRVAADYKSIANVGNAWVNHTGLNSVSAVDGIVTDTATGRIAFDEATNLGGYIGIVSLTGGVLTPAGSTAYLTTTTMDIQRYDYTTPFVWSNRSGQTILFNPFTNATLPAPNVVSRLHSSGANANFEFTDPLTVDRYLSFNGSLLGVTLAQNQFVFAEKAPDAGAGPVLFGAALGGIAAVVVLSLMGGIGIAASRGHSKRRAMRAARGY